jgi:O-methyltransferase involved in polyketide biosynthesis/RimJ/RimL family protein N-acetyltransferase
VQLGTVQQTLLITLAARARETGKKRAVLRDPKAVEMLGSIAFDDAKFGRGWGGRVTVLRTAIFDTWVSEFLAEHPGGTVVEIGSGLNTRFERVDNARVHWVDLDLPDVIDLRRKFFTDSPRRKMIAASVLDNAWPPVVEASPGPYFFVAEGVLVYLPEAPQVIARIARRFTGALIAFDSYTTRMLEQQHRLAAKKKIGARWAWACDDPRSLTSLGLEVVQLAAVTRPPLTLRARLPISYRYLLPIGNKLAGDIAAATLFRATRNGQYGAMTEAPELQGLRADHAPEVQTFELANRDYFAASISDRGDDYYEQFMDRYADALAEQETGKFAYYVLVGEDGSVLGRFNLRDINNGTAEVGYRVAKRAAGRGIATAGVRELCRLAASQHGVRVLRARTNYENVASQRVLAKAGFVPAGEADDVGGRPGIWYRLDLAD